jgi:phosphate transport system substrate-binding protein
MKKTIGIMSILILFVSCNQGSKEEKVFPGIQRVIKLKGSETIRNVVEKFINSFSVENPEMLLDYSGGGSVIGLMAFNANETDLAFISKELTPEEKNKLVKQNAVLDTLAIDVLSIVINVSNPISKLTIEELSGIYSGKIKNWSEVGGNNLPITLYSRDISSGTYSFFKNKVLDSSDYAGNDINLTHNEEIISNVSTTKNAIGYVGLSYSQNPSVKTIPIIFHKGEPAFYPNYQNIQGNTYQLKRYIVVIYPKNADEYLKKIVLSLDGEKTSKLINESGLIPFKKL